jgi:hypothetical protein
MNGTYIKSLRVKRKRAIAMELQTKQLILRPFIETDVEAVQSYAGNLENIRYMM